MRFTAPILALFMVLTASPAVAQKNCKKGKPCGNSCIAMNKTCRIGSTSSTKGTTSGTSSSSTGTAVAPEGTVAVASTRGTVYYSVACKAWESLAPANRVFFRSREAAEAKGYRPSAQKGCEVSPAAASSTTDSSSKADSTMTMPLPGSRDSTLAWVAAEGGKIYYRNDPQCSTIALFGPQRTFFKTAWDAERGGLRRSREPGC